MARAAGRAFWWLVATERPTTWLDYLGILALLGLAALGALAISWPWVSIEVPRAIGIGITVVQNTLAGWLQWLAANLPRWP